MILITLKDLSAGEAPLLLCTRRLMILIITRHRIRIRSLIVFPVALGLSLLGRRADRGSSRSSALELTLDVARGTVPISRDLPFDDVKRFRLGVPKRSETIGSINLHLE